MFDKLLRFPGEHLRREVTNLKKSIIVLHQGGEWSSLGKRQKLPVPGRAGLETVEYIANLDLYPDIASLAGKGFASAKRQIFDDGGTFWCIAWIILDSL